MINSVRGRLRAWERRDCFIAIYMKDKKRGERCVAIFVIPNEAVNELD